MKKQKNAKTKSSLEAASRWLPVFLWAAVIFILSSIQTVAVSEVFVWDFAAKKTAHFLEYAVLSVLIFRATGAKLRTSVILTMAYAASDEFHQSFVPGRTAAVYDLGFDFAGAALAAYLIWKLQLVPRFKLKK